MRYSVQSRDRIFVKVYEFLSLAENLGKNTGKDISKNFFQKSHSRNSRNNYWIWLVIKLLIELQKFQEIHNKIIHRQIQMRVIKKYLEKDMYHQKRYRKLLMN